MIIKIGKLNKVDYDISSTRLPLGVVKPGAWRERPAEFMIKLPNMDLSVCDFAICDI